MKTYHICYLKGINLSTGVNIFAIDYAQAFINFKAKFGNQKVVYITEKD